MAQRISVETKQKIAALYAEGNSGCKIAKIVGVSASSVCRIIKFKSEPAKSFRPAVPQGFKSLQAAVATALYCKSIGFDSEESIIICRRIGCGVDEMKNLAKWRSERDLKTEDEYKERIRELELKIRELEETNKAVVAENNAYRDALAKYATQTLLMKQDHNKHIEDLDKKHSKVVSKLECKLDFAKKVSAVFLDAQQAKI